MTALMRQLREALRDPFADPVTIDGCRIARRLARRFEREFSAAEARAKKLREQLAKADEEQPPRPIEEPAARTEQDSAAGIQTADDARRCEARAPEGPIRTAAEAKEPVNAREALSEGEGAAQPASPHSRIDLSTACSGMEAAAERWRGPVAAGEAARSFAVRQQEAGCTFCRCGGNGNEGGWVPDWFGRDCIERDCPLKVAA